MGWAHGYLGSWAAGAIVSTVPGLDGSVRAVAWAAWRGAERMEGAAATEYDAAVALAHFFAIDLGGRWGAVEWDIAAALDRLDPAARA